MKILLSIFIFLSSVFSVTTLAEKNNIQTIQLAAAPAVTAQDDDFTNGDDEDIEVSDPFESFNRAVFKFNDATYVHVLKPIARGYRSVVPQRGRESIGNFFSNLLAPVRIVNSAFQLKGQDASNETFRFLINSTIGVLGLFDVAKNDFRINIKKEDFGQTLGHYGVGNGPYLVIPFLGPSTIRDGVGLLVDGTWLDPIAYLDETGEYLAVKFVDIETTISLDKDTYEAIKKDSLDPYIFLRDAYIQHRTGAVKK